MLGLSVLYIVFGVLVSAWKWLSLPSHVEQQLTHSYYLYFFLLLFHHQASSQTKYYNNPSYNISISQPSILGSRAVAACYKAENIIITFRYFMSSLSLYSSHHIITMQNEGYDYIIWESPTFITSCRGQGHINILGVNAIKQASIILAFRLKTYANLSMHLIYHF